AGQADQPEHQAGGGDVVARPQREQRDPQRVNQGGERRGGDGLLLDRGMRTRQPPGQAPRARRNRGSGPPPAQAGTPPRPGGGAGTSGKLSCPLGADSDKMPVMSFFLINDKTGKVPHSPIKSAVLPL